MTKKHRVKKKSARHPAASKLRQRGFILVLVLAGLLFSSVYPMRRYFAVRAQIASLEREERDLDARGADLMTEAQRLRSDEAVEHEARERLGMVRPGEIPLVILTPGQTPKGAEVGVASEAEDPDDVGGFFSRAISVLKRATRALR